MMRRRHGAILLILLMLLAPATISACRPEAAGTAADRPTVACLVPSATEILFAMGQGHHLVGRSRYCNHPAEALRLPVVGDALSVNVERLLVLKPDLAVFNTSNPGLYERLAAAGIRCIAPRMESVADARDTIAMLGRELGAETAAADLDARLVAELDAVRAVAEQTTPVKTLITFPATVGGGSDVLVVGRDTFVDELLTLAGGRNVVASKGGYPRVSVETVVVWEPELIVISAPGDIAPGKTDDQYREAWSRWQAIPAVRQGRIIVLREPYLTLPGPRMGAAARLLLRTVHPECTPAPAREPTRQRGPGPGDMAQ